jgi:hypothetical protein
MWTVQNQGVAKNLRKLAAGVFGQLLGDGVAVMLGAVANFHFDEFMIKQGSVHGSHNFFSKAFFAGLYNDTEIVGLCSQKSTLLAG